MLRIVSQAIPPDNGKTYRRALVKARAALERVVAVTVPADASFAERERAVLAAANEACRQTPSACALPRSGLVQ